MVRLSNLNLEVRWLRGGEIEDYSLKETHKRSLAKCIGVGSLDTVTEVLRDKGFRDTFFPALFVDDKLVSFWSREIDHRSALEEIRKCVDKLNGLEMRVEVDLPEVIQGDLYKGVLKIGIDLFYYPSVYREESLLRLVCMNGAVVPAYNSYFSERVSESALVRYMKKGEMILKDVLLDMVKGLMYRKCTAHMLLRSVNILKDCGGEAAKMSLSTVNGWLEEVYFTYELENPVGEYDGDASKLYSILAKQPKSWLQLAELDDVTAYDLYNTLTYAISRRVSGDIGLGEAMDRRNVRSLFLKSWDVVSEKKEVVVPRRRSN